MSHSKSHLTNRSVFEISGKDARSFLQGLVTGDVEALEDGSAAHVGLLTPQGKIMFDFFVIGQPDGYLIDCSGDQIDDIIKRLTFYKLRAEVELAKRDDLGVVAVWGKAPAEIEGIVFADPRLAAMGWRVLISTEVNGGDDYDAHRIGLGVADTLDIRSGEMFPHEANFDQLNGVSFTKGCYVGQEVVSRMQHRGTTKSRFVVVTFSGKGPQTGDEIMTGEKKSGQVLSVTDGMALALIRLDRAKSALQAGQQIRANETELSVKIPDWADFTL